MEFWGILDKKRPGKQGDETKKTSENLSKKSKEVLTEM